MLISLLPLGELNFGGNVGYRYSGSTALMVSFTLFLNPISRVTRIVDDTTAIDRWIESAGSILRVLINS